MLHLLPPELAILIMSHLPPTSLSQLPLVSTLWKDILDDNATTIWQNVSVIEGYAELGSTLSHAKSDNAGHYMRDVKSWKEYGA